MLVVEAGVGVGGVEAVHDGLGLVRDAGERVGGRGVDHFGPELNAGTLPGALREGKEEVKAERKDNPVRE